MKKQITCNNAKTAIKSNKSSEIFKKILLNLNIPDENIKVLVEIFNKIKNGQPINTEEKIKIEEIISDGNFKSNLKELLTNYEIDEKKSDEFSRENILITIHSYISKSRIIDLLDKNDELEISQIKNRKFTKVVSGGKTNYLEIIQELNGFIFCKNIKGNKKIVLDIESGKIIFETKGDFKVKDIQYINGAIFLQNLGSGDDYIITSNFSIGYSRQSKIHLSKYDLFIIDPISRKIHRIDKKTLKLSEIDLYQYNILDIQKGNLLLFSPSINIGKGKNKTFSQGDLSLFNTDSNEEIISNIHLKYNKMTKEGFICLSYDEKVLYKYNFETKKIETIYLENIDKSGDELWKEIEKTHKI